MRRICRVCARIVEIVEGADGRLGWTELVDRFADDGFRREQVDRVLDAEVKGAPTLRDQLTSRMANELMRSLGMPGRQSPDDVRRVRHSTASGSQTKASDER